MCYHRRIKIVGFIGTHFYYNGIKCLKTLNFLLSFSDIAANLIMRQFALPEALIKFYKCAL